MDEARVTSHIRWRALIGLGACSLMLLAGCGQRGALYMPDKNAQVVTRGASSGPASAPASAPSPAPAAEPR
jgi:predicted small lipoprotein YifL